MVMMSLILFGMLQVALTINAKQVQQWAAFAGARSRVIGYHDNSVRKLWRVVNILNSGKMLAPQAGLSSVAQVEVEIGTIEKYMGSAYTAYELTPQFNYQRWQNLPDLPPAGSFDQYSVQAEENHPLEIAQLIPLLGASFGATNVLLKSQVTIENHFPFYLQMD